DAIEAPGAVERRLQQVARGRYFIVSECQRMRYSAADAEPPRVWGDGPWGIGDPARGRERVAGVASGLARASESLPCPWNANHPLYQLLRRPEHRGAQGQYAKAQRLPSAQEIALPQPLGAGEHMGNKDEDQCDPQDDVPVEQIEAGQGEVAALGPADA